MQIKSIGNSILSGYLDIYLNYTYRLPNHYILLLTFYLLPEIKPKMVSPTIVAGHEALIFFIFTFKAKKKLESIQNGISFCKYFPIHNDHEEVPKGNPIKKLSL